MPLQKYNLKQLEYKAADVISYFAPEYLKNGEPVPVQQFVDRLHHMGKCQFAIENLGFVGGTGKILGLFVSEPACKIFIDSTVVDTVRYNFTLAHELGHFVLHRKSAISGDLKDTSADLFDTPAELQSDRQWAEWQANNFASALLMPIESFYDAAVENAQRFGLLVNRNVICAENSLKSKAGLEKFAEYMANRFDVSKTSILIRLKKTGIVEVL